MRNITFFLLLTGVLAFCGCASPSEQMSVMVGRPVSDVIREWGPPTQSVPDGQGGQILSWTAQGTMPLIQPSSSTTYDPFLGTAHTTYSSGLAVPYAFIRMYWVDANGIIYNYAFTER